MTFFREAPTYTLNELSNVLDEKRVRVVDTTNEQILVDIPNGSVTVEGQEVPFTPPGMKALSSWLDVPYKFAERVPDDMKQYLFSNLLTRFPGEARVSLSDYGIEMIRSPQTKFIDPRSLVEVAARVIDPSAEVDTYKNTTEEFQLDIVVPEGFDRGIGGDRKVGDLTRGGIRMMQSQRANQTNIAPSVSEYLYRLACTNGMEVEDHTMKVDVRGNTVEEVLAEFEVLADRAFKRVESTIANFYDLRSQVLDNPTRTMRQVGREAGLAARTVGELVDDISLIDNATMFDVVNLMTNYANNPELSDGVRRRLQRAGGGVVREHVDRCSVCQSRMDI